MCDYCLFCAFVCVDGFVWMRRFLQRKEERVKKKKDKMKKKNFGKDAIIRWWSEKHTPFLNGRGKKKEKENNAASTLLVVLLLLFFFCVCVPVCYRIGLPLSHYNNRYSCLSHYLRRHGGKYTKANACKICVFVYSSRSLMPSNFGIISTSRCHANVLSSTLFTYRVVVLFLISFCLFSSSNLSTVRSYSFLCFFFHDEKF